MKKPLAIPARAQQRLSKWQDAPRSSEKREDMESLQHHRHRWSWWVLVYTCKYNIYVYSIIYITFMIIRIHHLNHPCMDKISPYINLLRIHYFWEPFTTKKLGNWKCSNPFFWGGLNGMHAASNSIRATTNLWGDDKPHTQSELTMIRTWVGPNGPKGMRWGFLSQFLVVNSWTFLIPVKVLLCKRLIVASMFDVHVP